MEVNISLKWWKFQVPNYLFIFFFFCLLKVAFLTTVSVCDHAIRASTVHTDPQPTLAVSLADDHSARVVGAERYATQEFFDGFTLRLWRRQVPIKNLDRRFDASHEMAGFSLDGHDERHWHHVHCGQKKNMVQNILGVLTAVGHCGRWPAVTSPSGLKLTCRSTHNMSYLNSPDLWFEAVIY